MQSKFSLGSGILLMVIGLFLLSTNFGIVDLEWEKAWPFIILILSFFFFVQFGADRSLAGMLIPGGILFVISIIFIIGAFFGWDSMEWLWPGFTLAPGFGLFLFYLATRIRAILIPVFILFVIGGTFLVMQIVGWDYWPVLFILVGAALILRPKIFQSMEQIS